MIKEFVECNNCITKPGIPILCDSCYNRRKEFYEDARKTGLKNGLRQLNIEQLERVIEYKGIFVLDSVNYENGNFCPLAIALELDKNIKDPTHEKVYNELVNLGYKVYNTRGIEGEFYTINRLEDLIEAAKEVLKEKWKL